MHQSGPLYSKISSLSTDIHPNARWQKNGLTVAGGNGYGNGINQLYYPWGLYVDDDDQTIYIADASNHRIVEWKWGATSGQVVAGGNGQGNGTHQLSDLFDPRRNGTSGETIIFNINCVGLTMDENGSLYVVDYGKHEVRRYRRGESQGIVVAGGNGIYVSDWRNDRVMEWVKGAKQGIVVAGDQGEGNGLTHLSCPGGVVVDPLGTVHVADQWNHRIMRWPKGATKGSVIVGGNGGGGQSNRLNWPIGLSFDRHSNLYVVDYRNHRVQNVNLNS
ncbi:unnamed protein product [Didymodactylos carnosus]|uniref:Uncharacterized protein n=1 Tax=Didymodactylos carnosus TaxID=1234261 RepID=A0A8S2QDR4_9BILA|nr:unnamed protein product [Didymodactylos carnosus]CAF4098550.1 unnamed protein product [Didymodactylos carnosus]